MIVFVNGLLAFGSPIGGKAYWGKGFVTDALEYFGDGEEPFFTNVGYDMFSVALKRILDGNLYACQSQCNALLHAKLPLRFVSHSMGGAFACGMMEALANRGIDMDAAVFINTFQPEKCEVPQDLGIDVTDYRNTDDPVLNFLDIRSRVRDIPHADRVIREPSGQRFNFRHKYPLSSRSGFWKKLKGFD
ncbi:MAG: hypothetical protein LKK19_03530 [Bacteroidales bacterium]|jgi:hypothetical protein|nr:hypothetical protein [Bacteroidales bacterium]MCI2121757.1 hypothetical protein [Bacteroidales bacterium]MCI2145898.1 hypothetical protein [Bacteroidales bacterium]